MLSHNCIRQIWVLVEQSWVCIFQRTADRSALAHLIRGAGEIRQTLAEHMILVRAQERFRLVTRISTTTPAVNGDRKCGGHFGHAETGDPRRRPGRSRLWIHCDQAAPIDPIPHIFLAWP